MLADGDHLRGEDAGRAVERGEGLVELGHVPADGPRALHQVDLLVGVGDLEGRLDAGDPPADHQRVGVHGRRVGHGGQREGHAQRGAGQHRLGALGAGAGGGAVLAERCQLDLFGVAAGQGHGAGEARLEEARRVAGDDDALDLGRLDLGGQGLGVDPGQLAQVFDDLDAGKIGGVAGDRVEVDRIGVADARLTQVHADSHTDPLA